jgi:nucleotide-binding universal stress UspA family protein
MRILLAVDGSDASMSAVAATAALPMRPGSTIEIVSVIPDTFAPEGSPWPAVIRVDPRTDRDRLIEDVSRRLMEIADRLRIGNRTVDVRVLEGRPATEIVFEAGRFRADLIVVGARGLSTVRRLLIGSVSSEVVDHAPCPVLVARRAAVERVMLAIDASPSAAAAADYIAESRLFDEAKIQVMTVADPGMPWWSGISPVDGRAAIDVYADAVEAAEHRARKAVDHVVERLQGIRVVETAVLPDADVVSRILEQAAVWRADLLVLGARNMGTVHRWLVGSVSRSILHLAEASVLIVRPRAAHAPEVETALSSTA